MTGSGYNFPMPNKFFPYIALVIGIVALSLSAMFVRWAAAPGPIFGFYRLFISTILLTPIFIRQQKNLERIDKKYVALPLLGGTFYRIRFCILEFIAKIHHSRQCDPAWRHGTVVGGIVCVLHLTGKAARHLLAWTYHRANRRGARYGQ